MTRVIVGILTGSAISCASTLANAQRAPELWGFATATSVRERANLGARNLTSSGTILGGEGGLAWEYVSLRAGYSQGTLSADGDLTHDYVESFGSIGARIVSGFELVGGLHGRAFVTTEGTQRWTFWQLRARYEAPIFSSMVRGYAELWRTASGEVHSPRSRGREQDLLRIIRLRLGDAPIDDAFRSSGGGAAGIIVRPGSGPFAVRLGYAIDETRLGAQKFRSTLEGLSLSVGMDGVRRYW